jgi:arylsulfatase A-like enzyme
VVIISVDGLRPDALTTAPAAEILSLIRQGAFSPDAETIALSETLPSHTSMLSGLDERRHRVTWNDYRPQRIDVPTVLSVAHDAGLSTAMLFCKDKFHFLAKPGQMNWIYGPRPGTGLGRGLSAEDLASKFTREWPRHLYQVTFIHLAEPDSAGHVHGWMTAEYLDAVRRADRAVGTIVDAVRKAGKREKTAFFLTADHGGHERAHYSPGRKGLVEDLTIPWICVGPGVPPGLVLERTVRITDTAPTALLFLGLKFPGKTDGGEVTELFRKR